eukprot:TRINITY_DN570_c0_g1_i1.p1 TRINITY_DN570_c0_g1~~TRINITY_DN570_c0_g1_i1.p1  ORF type:complete len:520 (-),score=92.54 TRINITY_DN570_c0_g1_i1:128-1687(-)
MANNMVWASNNNNNWRLHFSLSIFLLCSFEFIVWANASQVPTSSSTPVLQSWVTGTQQIERDDTAGVSVGLIAPIPPRTEQELLAERVAQREERAASKQVDSTEDVQGEDEDSWWALGQSTVVGGLSALVVVLLYPLSRTSKAKKVAELVLHPWELLLLLKYKFIYSHTLQVALPPGLSPSALYCYQKLPQVSRSFAAVILELPTELRDAICIFYLVLRALDTIEDDMSVPTKGKVEELNVFYQHLEEPGWTLSGYGDVPAERDLLEQFHHCQTVYKTLPARHQEIIRDITKRMGDGMADFAERSVVSVSDYNKYCHYVAGVVGIGLSQMFSASGLESEAVGKAEEISNSMGLFLQKTNITRDYYEDINAVHSRMFYPKEIWGKYAQALSDLMRPDHATKAVHCLNHMITDATVHIPHCIQYLQSIKNPAIFKFCAIPQAMAIATMAKLYNNHAVFTREVKIRKGEAVAIIMSCTDFKTVCQMFQHYVRDIQRRIDSSDPNAKLLRSRLRAASELIAAL